MQNLSYIQPFQNGYFIGVPICGCSPHFASIHQSPIPKPNLGVPQSTGFILKDYGDAPFTVNIHEAAKQNTAYRTALWTGEHLQVTLMSIDVGDDIGLEIHHDNDQFLRIEEGQGLVQMGKDPNRLDFIRPIGNDSAIMVPVNTWHNIINTGNTPLKLYSIYAPPHHPKGTVHQTKAIAFEEEELH